MDSFTVSFRIHFLEHISIACFSSKIYKVPPSLPVILFTTIYEEIIYFQSLREAK